MKNPQVDVYIDNAAPFAQPIIKHVRKLIHKACPEVEETIKWGVPHFEYKGVICNIAAFKAHCAMGFWKESLIPEMKKHIKQKDSAWGDLGRITSLKDLPSDKLLISWTKAAVLLNKKGIKVEKVKTPTKELKTPAYLSVALNKKAKEVWDNFSVSKKNEYIEWLLDAKTEETKNKRLNQALEWISEGKDRNWKYR